MAGTGQSHGGRRGAIVGINVTPMVDVVLVLLVIMMVSATYIVSQSLKVELPKTATSDESTPTLVAVTVTKEGSYFLDQKPVTEDELPARLHAAQEGKPDLSLVITADEAATHGKVVRVIDIAKVEGISKFAINVERSR